MNCIAHRGFAAVNPENTLAAVEAAVAAGAAAVEVDIRRCGSGELVVIHDVDVGRVTGASGEVGSFSAAELAELSVLGSGEGVPTLGAVCRAVPPAVRLVLDLKERGIAVDAVETARSHDCALLVSSFSAAALAEVESVSRAYLFDDAPGPSIEAAVDLGCTAVHPHWQLCSRSVLATAREHGFEVNAWTVTSDSIAAALAAVEVDGLITDALTYCEAAARGSRM